MTQFRRVLNYGHPTSLAALTMLGHKTFNRLVVHVDSAIVTYSLDILARLALDKSQAETLDASMERVGANDGNIVICKHIQLEGRALCSYISINEFMKLIAISSDIWLEAAIRNLTDVACSRGT